MFSNLKLKILSRRKISDKGRPFTGPDERHTIHKMTSTKVECQEMHSEGPHVEEIASYSYTIHQEDGTKAQNGVLIEEYSEGDDNKAKLQVNRGVSIVSVSDDESTMKAISRDVSTDDVHAELSDDRSQSCFVRPDFG